MRKLITSSVGIVCGIIIIIMAFLVTGTPLEFEDASFVKLDASSFDPIMIPDNYTSEHENNHYYGGDAYTGMQQAAAQAANNVLAMEETLFQTNQNILAVNNNLKKIGDDLVDTNNNMVKAFKQEQKNTVTAALGVSSAISKAACFLLLAVGMITIVNHLPAFLESLEEVLAEKRAAAAVTVNQEETAEEEAVTEEETAVEEETAAEEKVVAE